MSRSTGTAPVHRLPVAQEDRPRRRPRCPVEPGGRVLRSTWAEPGSGCCSAPPPNYSPRSPQPRCCRRPGARPTATSPWAMSWGQWKANRSADRSATRHCSPHPPGRQHTVRLDGIPGAEPPAPVRHPSGVTGSGTSSVAGPRSSGAARNDTAPDGRAAVGGSTNKSPSFHRVRCRTTYLTGWRRGFDDA